MQDKRLLSSICFSIPVGLQNKALLVTRLSAESCQTNKTFMIRFDVLFPHVLMPYSRTNLASYWLRMALGTISEAEEDAVSPHQAAYRATDISYQQSVFPSSLLVAFIEPFPDNIFSHSEWQDIFAAHNSPPLPTYCLIEYLLIEMSAFRRATMRRPSSKPTDKSTMETVFPLLEAACYVATCLKALNALGRLQIRSADNGVGPAELTPVTALHYDGESSLEHCFSNVVERFEASDGVFSFRFLSPWVLLNVNQTVPANFNTSRLREVLRDAARSCDVEWTVKNIIIIEDSGVAEGPYFLKSGILQAWRLYPDFLDSFQLPVIPDLWGSSKGVRFTILRSLSEDGLAKNVAVPSRLYFRPTREKPLAGIRVAIKDNIRLRGIVSGNMDQTKKRGAVIVGKTKLGAFASAEDPPLQWVDFPCSWTPRTNGYQQPLGSITGGTTCIVGYPIPCPCCVQWGAAPFGGMLPNCPQFDTIGLLARSVEYLQDMSKHSFAPVIKDVTEVFEPKMHFCEHRIRECSSEIVQKYPRTLLYNTDFWSPSPHTEEYQAIVDEFLKILEAFGISKAIFSMSERWEKNPPPEANGKTLDEQYSIKEYMIRTTNAISSVKITERNLIGPPMLLPTWKANGSSAAKLPRSKKKTRLQRCTCFASGLARMLWIQIPRLHLMQSCFYRRGKESHGYQSIAMATLLASPQLIIPSSRSSTIPFPCNGQNRIPPSLHNNCRRKRYLSNNDTAVHRFLTTGVGSDIINDREPSVPTRRFYSECGNSRNFLISPATFGVFRF
ncbi:uncharacterized protein BDR25DRAFT_362802 [Lindgomyces ingoldianus]|uniref:Uncharacterized protein n=1 Tax=Lindgomyces ingoldianus TaxID=673940 RepID=A0ACB6Q969_9PLEO|nr:uncharacterized protein BDR25DRAFT_362802 [Lindgomyces ingoldianus]KAF2463449.1 hypothetical protein BDR25DRAFT_362802 [Lindgomyces ingoldianus]